jgi:hypothetical protein
MSIFDSETESREGQAPTVRDDSRAVGRLVRFAGRVLLWGCVLMLLVRGVASEFHSPQTGTTTRALPAPLRQPAAPASTTEGK